MTEKKTKKVPKAARVRTVPAADAPAPQSAAPEPAPAVVEPPGLRVPVGWNSPDRNPRPVGPLTKTAVLIRGVTWTLSYSTGPVVFRHGESVEITESEFERLAKAIDRIDFADPGTGLRVQRSIRKFRFFDSATGDEVEMEVLPDVQCGPGADTRDIFERAAAEKKFQGQEFTSR